MVSGIFNPLYLTTIMKIPFRSKEGRRSVTALTANNILIIAGFILLGWDLATAVLIFWFEGIIIGFSGIVKVIIRAVYDFDMPDEGPVFKTFTISVLFVMYTGLFLLLIFMTALFLPLFLNALSDIPVIPYAKGAGLMELMSGLVHYIRGEFFSFDMPVSFVSLVNIVFDSKFIIIPDLLITHAYLFKQNFINKKLYLTINIKKLIIRPAGRFFMLYMFLSFLFLPFIKFISCGSRIPAVVIWMICKTFYDIYGGHIDILIEDGTNT